MARVPTARNLVQQQPMTDAKFRAFDSGAEAIGEGVRDFGRSMGQAANDWDHIEAQKDETAAKAKINAVSQRVRERLWTGDDAYFRKEGLDADAAKPQIDKFFTDLKSEFGAQARSPRERQMFDDAFDRIHGQEAEGVARHAFTQLKAEQTRQSAARMTNFQDDAIRFADDPARFAENMQGGLIELRTQADQHGWAPETLKAAEADFKSKTHAAVVEGKLANDVDGANAYLEKHRGDLSWKDAQELDARLARPLAERQAYVDADGIFGLAPTPSAPGQVGQTVSDDQQFDAIVKIEGGTDRQGRFLTSPKGAIGPAQVMPGTAPEAARLAGLPYDERRYKSDAAYNLALGKAYYRKQLSDFGDPIKAAAAYNAGPGRSRPPKPGEGDPGLRGAMRRAAAAGRPDAWREYLPSETRDYIKKFGTITNDPTVRQAPQRHDLNQLLARADIQAEQQGWSFERREAAKAEIERRVRRDETLVERQEATADRAAQELILGKGEAFTDTSQIPRSTWASMSVSARDAAVKRAEANRTPKEPPANSVDAMRLHAIQYGDPDTFRNMDLTPFIGKVTRGELDSAISEQAKMRGPAGDKIMQTRSSISTAISYQTAFDPAMGKLLDKNKNPENYARVARDMEGYLTSVTGGKREPTSQEVDAAWKRAVMPVAVPNSSLFGKKVETKPRFESGGRYQVSIPIVVRERIINSWRKAHGGQMPPDGVIGDIYVQNKGKPGFWQ